MLRRTASATVLLSLILLAVAAAAPAAVPLGGSPLNVFVGERGQLQAFRTDRTDPTSAPGIFYNPNEQAGDAGFFIALNPGLGGKVYGFSGNAGPFGLEPYEVVTQGGVAGSGSGADPLKQVTTYEVESTLFITQTTTYVNGAQELRVHWDVRNDTGGAVKFKALAAADFFFEGDDAGVGIFTAGPPRFIGGTNINSGSSGGFVEVTGGGVAPWSAYQALRYGLFDPDSVWGKIEASADSSSASFDDSVLAEAVDNAGGIEWDQYATTGLASGATAAFETVVRSAVPSALQLNPTNAASRQGVPIGITATATDSNGAPYAGKTLRYSIAGPNATTGSATLDASGAAVMTDPGAKAGTDTLTAFVDFNSNGSRDASEPQASALATFVDSVPPTCSIKASGTVVGGSGAGQPLVITVNCGEGATVTVATTLTAPAGPSASSSKKAKKIKLKPVKKKVKKGKPTAIRIKIPKSIAHRYAGQTLKAKIATTARDKAGNKRKKVKTTTIHFARLR